MYALPGVFTPGYQHIIPLGLASRHFQFSPFNFQFSTYYLRGWRHEVRGKSRIFVPGKKTGVPRAKEKTRQGLEKAEPGEKSVA
jgi:hypothetical protein